MYSDDSGYFKQMLYTIKDSTKIRNDVIKNLKRSGLINADKRFQKIKIPRITNE